MGKAASGKMPIQKILYCGSFFVALLACVAACATAVAAQEERPQIEPGERKAPRKKDAGPRAVGVLQLAPNSKATLVPVAILINGRFWDATAYKADPVPMALESGTVYEAERAGSSLGLFTVGSALHSNAVNVQSPWIGTGAWLPAGAEKPKTAFKAEPVPVGMEPSDAPPRLSRNTRKETAPASAPPSSPPSTTKPSAPPQSPPGGSAGSGQPNSGPTSTGQPSPNSPAPPAPGDSKPNDTKPSDLKVAAVPPASQSDSGANEAIRPRLRRGRPVEPLPEDEVPGYSKPGAVASAASPAGGAKISESTPDKSSIQSIPAISDASGPEPRSFAFEWLKDEEGERRQQMLTMAKEYVRAYVDARAKSQISAKPASPPAARRPAASKTPASKTKEPILENVQMIAYDLWNNNQPVLVLTADAHLPPPAAGTPHAEADSDRQYSILLVTHPDIYSNLHKLFVGVTDKFHLDVTPRFELIDAVDADGDGRGELLFRETSDAGNGWVIYRATVDKLWKVFDSLSPQ